MEEDGRARQLLQEDGLDACAASAARSSATWAGIREMTGIPGAMVVSTRRARSNAVREARRMGLPVIGILDTDCDPSMVDIVIPGNDDALKSVRLLIDRLVELGRGGRRQPPRARALDGRGRGAARTSLAGDEPRPTRGNAPWTARPRRAAAPATEGDGARGLGPRRTGAARRRGRRGVDGGTPRSVAAEARSGESPRSGSAAAAARPPAPRGAGGRRPSTAPSALGALRHRPRAQRTMAITAKMVQRAARAHRRRA